MHGCIVFKRNPWARNTADTSGFGSVKFRMYSVYWGLYFKIAEFETLTAVIFSRDILFKRAGVFCWSEINKRLFIKILASVCFFSSNWGVACPVRLAARTPDSHSGNRGSIPLRGASDAGRAVWNRQTSRGFVVSRLFCCFAAFRFYCGIRFCERLRLE